MQEESTMMSLAVVLLVLGQGLKVNFKISSGAIMLINFFIGTTVGVLSSIPNGDYVKGGMTGFLVAASASGIYDVSKLKRKK